MRPLTHGVRFSYIHFSLVYNLLIFSFFLLFRSESRTSGNVSNCLNSIQVLYCKTWPGGSRKGGDIVKLKKSLNITIFLKSFWPDTFLQTKFFFHVPPISTTMVFYKNWRTHPNVIFIFGITRQDYLIHKDECYEFGNSKVDIYFERNVVYNFPWASMYIPTSSFKQLHLFILQQRRQVAGATAKSYGSRGWGRKRGQS